MASSWGASPDTVAELPSMMPDAPALLPLPIPPSTSFAPTEIMPPSELFEPDVRALSIPESGCAASFFPLPSFPTLVWGLLTELRLAFL